MNDRNRARDHGSGGALGGLGGRGLLVTVPVLVEARLASFVSGPAFVLRDFGSGAFRASLVPFGPLMGSGQGSIGRSVWVPLVAPGVSQLCSRGSEIARAPTVSQDMRLGFKSFCFQTPQ